MLTKQSTNINFASGLDTKTDPKQVSFDKFLALENTVFNRGGLLTKRNGYAALTALPNNTSAYLTILNDNLTAIGTTINAYSAGSASWVSKGTIQPMNVSTLSLIKNNLNQTQVDSAVAVNGLVCTAYTEVNGASTIIKYAIADSNTGQNIIAPIALPVGSGTPTGSPRVFLLGVYFIIVFTNLISAVSHLQYIAISTTNPLNVSANTDIAAAYIPATTLSWDGVVANNNLYIAYNNTTGGQSIKVTFLTTTLTVATPVTFAASKATIMSMCADISTPSSPIMYASFYDSAGSTGYTLAVDKNLNTILAPTEIIASGTFVNLASAAQNGICTVYGEVTNAYAYDSAIPTNYIDAVTVTQAGTVGTPYVALRSVGLASKAFIVSGIIYFLAAYQSTYQPSYFLVNGSTSTSAAPVIVGKLAYSNGGGYLTLGLPQVQVTNGNVAQLAYLYKDFIEALNTLSNPQQTTSGGIYSQTGINLGTFEIGTQGIDTAEIASNLHLSGGFLGQYDGYLPVEHNFFVWPDNVEATWSATGGSIHAQPDGATNTNAYYYQAVYSWSDNQGLIYRSAPSIPIPVTTTSNGTAGSITVHIPTLRLTMKTANPVKIELYRWSVANQTYYQVSQSASVANPVLAPELNSTTTDAVTFVDTWADASIVGNNIIYTTGGVVEDINGPATNILTLFDTRLWLVNAEDRNQLWFSKQVIENTPAEMSDLFTIYVPATAGAQGSTGPITALAPMDDKLIVFKKDAIYYLNGTGPDNTGANNQYSQVIFITSTVGCADQNSVVITRDGLMFQSDKGIWLLGRDLSTQYIGAPVEEFNSSVVQSAVNVPATNQIRFTLDTGQTLMYDYFYQQWGTFYNVPAISSCTFQGLHTYINSSGAVFQESPGKYLDGSNPVLINFQTSWLKIGDLQSYGRSYFFFILGQYLTPHKLQLSIEYDYQTGPTQTTLIQPNNFSPAYGSGASQSPYGQGSPYGGPGDLEQWRVDLTQQRCMAIRLTLQEVYDPSFGVPAGAGLTLSGINFIYGIKSKFRPVRAANQAGGKAR